MNAIWLDEQPLLFNGRLIWPVQRSATGVQKSPDVAITLQARERSMLP
jgi:hypothetical protein